MVAMILCCTRIYLCSLPYFVSYIRIVYVVYAMHARVSIVCGVHVLCGRGSFRCQVTAVVCSFPLCLENGPEYFPNITHSRETFELVATEYVYIYYEP